jgi:hypothetical protein
MNLVRRNGMKGARGWLVVAMTLLCGHTVLAETNTVYNFLRTDVSSRAAGMAGSFVGVINDPTTIFYNPAGLSTMTNPMGSIGFFKHLLDINTGYISYAQEIPGAGFVGGSVLYTSYGSFTRTDEAANDLGTFSAGDLAVIAGYSNLLDENLHYGINIKYIYSSIEEYSSTGLAGDFGILYVIPDSKVTLAASILNVGTQLTEYGSTKEDLPLDVVVGGSVVPRGIPLLLHVSFHKLNASTEDFGERFRAFRIGGEFTLGPSFQLRFGYDNEKRTDLKIGSTAGLAGFSGGFGIVVTDYRLDYAISSLGSIGEWHRVSIGVSL